MDTRARRNAQGGFSVVELMVVVTILGILAAVAAPNMGQMIRTQRLKTAAFDVYSSLVFARSEAIKRNTTVSITPNADWAKGWEIKDVNTNMVLRTQSGWDNIQAAGPAQLRFGSSGRVVGATGDISLTADNVYANANRCIRLDASGRAVTKEGAC